MILRMSNKPRPYILKKERAGYYEAEIKKAEEELLTITDDKKIKAQKELITALGKMAVDQAEYLKKYKPTTFNIRNASKERLASKELHQNATIGKLNDDSTELTAGMTGITKYMAIQAFKEGFESVTNVYDQDLPEGERKPQEFGKSKVNDVINSMDTPDIQEIASEILGTVSEDDEANLS